MKIDEIRKIAKKLGVPDATKIKTKADLIRAIQRTEGNPECYQTDPYSCGQSICLWLTDCTAAVNKRC